MKVAVLVSGGVDSSVALNLLKKENKYDITAFYLKIWLEEEFQFLGQCPWEEDLSYARAVCDQAGVPLEVVSLQTPYWDKVVSHTVAELKAGRTPSPDILCNQRVKFGAFCDFIDDSYMIASGHYARVEHHPSGKSRLSKGLDPIKDQTYFLSRLSQEQLSRILFPIGHLPKSDVREIAEDLDLANKARKDSQGICFLGKIKYNEFVRMHLGDRPGAIIEVETQKVVGEHLGFWYHTIGQRKGLGLSGGPWFVVSKDCDKNIVYASKEKLSPAKPRKSFPVRALHWLSEPPENGASLSVKIRHGERVTACHLNFNDDKGIVELEDEDGGIAPGQYAVFYNEDLCLGSGIIAEPSLY